jgi:hypothetical protein
MPVHFRHFLTIAEYVQSVLQQLDTEYPEKVARKIFINMIGSCINNRQLEHDVKVRVQKEFSQVNQSKILKLVEGQLGGCGLFTKKINHLIEGDFCEIPPPFKDRSPDSFGRFQVEHKLYYAIAHKKTDCQTAFDSIQKFVSLVPSLYIGILAITSYMRRKENIKDCIGFKFAVSLEAWINHSAQLVIYFYDKQSIPHIEEVVDRVFRPAGIKFKKRRLLGSYGFDFKDFDRDWSASHAKLISMILADEVLKRRKEISNWSKKDVAIYLRDRIYDLKKQDIKSIHDLIVKIA